MNSAPTDTNNRSRSMLGIAASAAIVIAAGVLLVRMLVGGGGVAPNPDSMPVTTDLSSVAFQTNKPIVAIVTADWCGPCQELKRSTLSDERVQRLLADQGQPVIIDGTDTSAAMPTLERLGVRAFPSTVVLRDGQPVAMLEGYASADKYLAWLEGQL